MWNVVKSLFRYSSKNVLSLTMLSVLMILASTVFGSLNFLSSNLSNSYDFLVNNGNLNNIVINELYSTTYKQTLPNGTTEDITGEVAAQLNKQAFYKELSNLIGANNYRSFEAIDFSNVSEESQGFIYKIINNPNDVTIDKTVIYSGQNVFNQTFDFDQIIHDANLSVNSVYTPSTTPKPPVVMLNSSDRGEVSQVDGSLTNPSEAKWPSKPPGGTGTGGGNTGTNPPAPSKPVGDPLLGARARRLVLFLASKALWTAGTGNFVKVIGDYLRVTSDITNPDFDPAKTNKKDYKTINDKIKMWCDPNESNYTPLTSKGYRLAFDFAGPPSGVSWVPIVGKIDNVSSYVCVASPSTVQKQNKQLIPSSTLDVLSRWNNSMVPASNAPYDFNYAQSKYVTQEQLMLYIDHADPSSLIQVDQLRYFIVGTGISPNFMYPVYSFERQTPNINSEALIYANDAGYNLAFDSARSAPIESYIVAKVNENNLSEIINQINDIAAKYMRWPYPLKAAYAADDTSNMLAPVALRIVFIPELVKTQVLISTILSIFLMVLILMIFIFTIKKFINDLRVPLGILRANGVSKRSIIFAMPILCLIPSVAGGLIGYLISQFTQTAFLDLYSFYWTIPTPIISFSPGMFFGLLLVPFAVMGIIAIIYTYLVLRQNAASIMKETSSFKATPLSKLVTKASPRMGILAKFRTSIAFSSIPKLTMITVMFSLLSISIYLGLGLNNQFETAKNNTFKNKNYSFSVDLIQPTYQGGQYFRQQPEFPGRVVLDDKGNVLNFNIGMADEKFILLPTYSKFRMQTQSNSNRASLLYMDPNNQYKYKGNFNPRDPNPTNPNKIVSSKNINGLMLLNHLPSGNDSGWQKSDFTYLNYKLENPMTVNAIVGAQGIATANPWDIARNLAPMNQITLANKKYKQMWTLILNDTNVYFDEQSLWNNGLDKIDIKGGRNPDGTNNPGMINHDGTGKPLNQIVKDYGYIKLVYNSSEPKSSTNQILPIKEDTVEIYGNPNDPKDITQQWQVDYDAINNTATIKYPYAVIMATLLNFNNKLEDQQAVDAFMKSKYYNPNTMNIDYVRKYKECFFNIFYSYIPMNENDETYTYVPAKYNGDEISIKGIKPDSTHMKLENRDNVIVNDKLKLENIDESQYPEEVNTTDPNAPNVHDIYKQTNPNDYFSSQINNPSNFKIIINETAAYKYNLKVGDVITIDPTKEAVTSNTGTNITYQNPNKQKMMDDIRSTTYNFKVVDIIETFQNPEFYINQRVANFINGMATDKFINQSFYNETQASQLSNNARSWYDYSETTTIKAIDPFNGFFSSEPTLPIIDSLALYTQSGLAPGNDKFSKSNYYEILIDNVMKSTDKDLGDKTKQSSYISKMVLANALGYDITNKTDLEKFNKTYGAVDASGKVAKDTVYQMIDDLISIYGESPLLSSSIYIEPIQTFTDLFTNISTFINSIFIMVLIIILLLTVLSIYYLAIDFIKSSIDLIAMMKAYGFNNGQNTFSFLSIFFPAIIIGFAVSFVAIPIFVALKNFILGFANIYLPIGLEWWYPFVALLVSFSMLAITLLIALYNLKKLNVSKAITRN